MVAVQTDTLHRGFRTLLRVEGYAAYSGEIVDPTTPVSVLCCESKDMQGSIWNVLKGTCRSELVCFVAHKPSCEVTQTLPLYHKLCVLETRFLRQNRVNLRERVFRVPVIYFSLKVFTLDFSDKRFADF